MLCVWGFITVQVWQRTQKISSGIKVLKGCNNGRNPSHNCISDFEGLEGMIS